VRINPVSLRGTGTLWIIIEVSNGLPWVMAAAGGIAVGFSQPEKVQPPERIEYIISKKPLAYQNGFQDGFSHRAKKKRLVSSIIGGVLGTATLYAIYKGLEDAFSDMQ